MRIANSRSVRRRSQFVCRELSCEGRINDSIAAFEAAIAGGVVGSSLQVMNSQNDHPFLEHFARERASLIVYDGPRDTVMHDPTLL